MKLFHVNRNSVKLSELASILLLLRWSFIINIIASILYDAVATTKQCSLERISTVSTEGLIDFEVNPCYDFFDYACGNWHLPYALRALQAHDSLTAAGAENKRQLLQYFEGQVEDEPEIVAEQQRADSISSSAVTNQTYYAVRKFYKSCIEETGDDKEVHNSAAVYMAALQQFKASRILNYNLINNNVSQLTHDLEWWQIAAELRLLGVQTFWQLILRPNWQSAEQHIIYLVPPKFGYMQNANVNDHLNTESVEMQEIIFLQQRYVKYLLLDLGLRIRPALKLADELVEFELALMKLKDHEDSLILHEPQTLLAWSQQLPELHLQAYFQKLLLPNDSSSQEEPGEELKKLQQMLLVLDINYLRKLQKFLTAAEPHLVARYMLIKFLTHFELHLDTEQGYMEHKLYCLQQLQTFLPRELAQLFLELQFNNSAQDINQMQSDLTLLFDKLKQQFESTLQQTDIFEHDATGKELSLEKLRDMRLILPQLQQVTAPTSDYKLTQEYSHNLLELWRLRVHRELAVLGMFMKSAANSSVPDSLEYTNADETYASLDVNAYYKWKKNAVELPVGMLTSKFYKTCMALPELYGRLMYIIAHELMHGYDYDGFNYDKVGNLGNSLDPKTIAKYGQRARCYFSERYTFKPLYFNENIADNEGLRLALDALLVAQQNQGKHISEEDLKLFFLNFAQTWCGTKKLHGTRAKHRERVNNVVSNFKEFATVYKCKVNSTLNPTDKCKIW